MHVWVLTKGLIIWRFSTRVKISTRYTELKEIAVIWKISTQDEIKQPRVNRKFNKNKKANLEARQKQIKPKVAAVNKKLKCVILQQVNALLLLLLQMLPVIENYQYSRMRILHMIGEYYIFHGILWSFWILVSILWDFKLVKRHSKSACEVTIFVF